MEFVGEGGGSDSGPFGGDTTGGHVGRHELNRVALRGFMEMMSLSVVGDGIPDNEAPHRRLLRIIDAGDTPSVEDTQSWFHMVHQSVMGNHRINCTAMHLETGKWHYKRALTSIPSQRANVHAQPSLYRHLLTEHTVTFDASGGGGQLLSITSSGVTDFHVCYPFPSACVISLAFALVLVNACVSYYSLVAAQEPGGNARFMEGVSNARLLQSHQPALRDGRVAETVHLTWVSTRVGQGWQKAGALEGRSAAGTKSSSLVITTYRNGTWPAAIASLDLPPCKCAMLPQFALFGGQWSSLVLATRRNLWQPSRALALGCPGGFVTGPRLVWTHRRIQWVLGVRQSPTGEAGCCHPRFFPT